MFVKLLFSKETWLKSYWILYTQNFVITKGYFSFKYDWQQINVIIVWNQSHILFILDIFNIPQW